MTKRKRGKRPAKSTRPAKRNWLLPELHDRGFLPRGSQYWETRGGDFRLVKSEWCDGIEMPVEWKVWQKRRNCWCLCGEYRSKKRALREIAARSEQLDTLE